MGKPLIAIVDDDSSVREALGALMRSLGYAVEVFACGDDMLGSPTIERAACLIADVQMPGMNGFELQAGLIAAGKPIPTVLITAYPSEEARSRAFAAGAVGFLAKPWAEHELIRCLDLALRAGSPS
jgi:FixJ family two-component response regulator